MVVNIAIIIRKSKHALAPGPLDSQGPVKGKIVVNGDGIAAFAIVWIVRIECAIAAGAACGVEGFAADGYGGWDTAHHVERIVQADAEAVFDVLRGRFFSYAVMVDVERTEYVLYKLRNPSVRPGGAGSMW